MNRVNIPGKTAVTTGVCFGGRRGEVGVSVSVASLQVVPVTLHLVLKSVCPLKRLLRRKHFALEFP